MTQLKAHFGKLAALAVLMPCVVLASVDVELAWDPSPDASVIGYNVYYGAASAAYTNRVTVGNVTNAIVRGLKEATTYYFAATAFNSDNLESDFSNEVSWLASTNRPPTLDNPPNLLIAANSGARTVTLTGIGSGSTNETQTLTVTATSSNPTIIANPTVNYTSPAATGNITFAPKTNMSGVVTLTVTVSDGQASTARSFTVRVRPVPGGKPRITKETLFSQVIWSGEPNGLYAVEHSDNLKKWEPWTIVQAEVDGNFGLFELPLAEASYYRAKEYP